MVPGLGLERDAKGMGCKQVGEGWHVVAGVWLGREEVLSLGRPGTGLGRLSFPFSAREAAAFPERRCFPRRLPQPSAPVGPACVFSATLHEQPSLGKTQFQGGDPSAKFFAEHDAACPVFQGTGS